MFWIRVASDLADSPKVGALSRELRVTRDSAFARMVTLWGWVARHAPTGDLTSVPDSEVADGAKWRGRPERFVAGLQAAGLMDGRIIHDWDRMNGRSLAECARVKAWKEKRCLRRQTPEPVTRNVTQPVTQSVTQPITCKRNVTERNVTTTQQETAMSAAADAPAAPPLPGVVTDKEFEMAWNSQVANVPKIKVWTPGRAAKLRARFRDDFFRENWRAAISKIGTSAFAQGAGSTGWRLSVDFFLTPDGVVRIMEGKYDGNGTGAPGRRVDSGRSFAAALDDVGKFEGR